MFEDSFILQQSSVTSGLPMAQLVEELDTREQYMEAIVESGIKIQSEVAEKIAGYQNIRKSMMNSETPKVEDLWEVGQFNPFKLPDINDLFEFIHLEEKRKAEELKPEVGNNWDEIQVMLNQLREDAH
mgnify:CR=1 FL=1